MSRLFSFAKFSKHGMDLSRRACFLLTIVFLFNEAGGCGILTHTEIGHRAMFFFNDRRAEHTFMNMTYKQMIEEHQDAFQAGNPYPDTMYDSLCFHGKYHQVAEDTHWTPFMVTTIDYIREKYPPPWNVAAQKLVVFLLGFVSHQIADVLWHNLGTQNGFLQAMADANFHGSFGAAHDAGDLGGDVVGSFEWDKDFVKDITWYVPSQDLQEIYHLYYQQHGGGAPQVNASTIAECSTLIYLGRFAEKLALQKLFPSHAKGSPFLVEELSEYFMGGLDDNAAWSGLLWHDAITMLENGTNVCSHGKNPISVKCPNAVPRQQLLTDENTKPIFRKLYLGGLNSSHVIVERTLRGVHLKPSKELKRLLLEKQAEEDSKKAKLVELTSLDSEAVQSSLTAQVTFMSKMNYSRLGWALTSGDVNADKFQDLLIGAPGYSVGKDLPQAGCVYIVLSNNGQLPGTGFLDMETVASMKLEGRTAFGRFGSALAVMDLNRDSFSDVAVGSPSTGAASLQYSGAVELFFNTGHGLPPVANSSLENNVFQGNLGWSLAGGDLDGDGFADLVVGSPFFPTELDQRGQIMVYTSSTFQEGEPMKPVWIASGSIRSSWFGKSLQIPKDSGLLLVGSPDTSVCLNSKSCASFSQNDTQSVGNLTIYKGTAKSKFEITYSSHGMKQFEKFGSSADIGLLMENTRVLAVSSPTADVEGHIVGVKTTFNQAGRVLLYNLTAGNMSEPFAVLEGDRSFARFGWAVDLSDINGDSFDDLVITAPLRIYDLTEELTGGEKGEAYIYLGGEHFPKSKDVTNSCGLSTIRPCPSHAASFTLDISKDKTRFGSSLTIIGKSASSPEQKASVVVGAIRSEAGSRTSGAVHVFTP